MGEDMMCGLNGTGELSDEGIGKHGERNKRINSSPHCLTIIHLCIRTDRIGSWGTSAVDMRARGQMTLMADVSAAIKAIGRQGTRNVWDTSVLQ